MNDWWRQRNPREQAVLRFAAVAATAMLAWAFVMQPMSARQSALQARIAAQEATLQQLAQARDLLDDRPSSPSRAPDFGDRSMASVIEQGLRMAGMAAAIRRIEPAGDGSVSLVLEQAPFDSLVQWLQETSAGPGITVREMSLDRAEGSGTVNARIRLSAGS